MRNVLIGLALVGLQTTTVSAGSDLLNEVKRNPQQAKSMCRDFKELNENRKSAHSKKSIRTIAKSRKLSNEDAEVLVTYVVGMHCPNVR
jgi:hypothetical protein